MQELVNHITNTPYPKRNIWLKTLKAQSSSAINAIKTEIEEINQRVTHIKLAKFNYPLELPISQAVNLIKELIQNNQVIIISGETGSGKTTQLPKILLELGYANFGIIGHTQPRRIAAKSLAQRINQELNPELGLVGLKMRFSHHVTSKTAIKLMTDGILLQEISQDKLLLQYSALIIDEVHERSLNIDFILGYLKTILKSRPDLRVIITSATTDTVKIAKFFNSTAVINVSGKTYPVDVIYQELEEKSEFNLNVYQAIKSLFAIELGNVLVFLPGEGEIKNLAKYLAKTDLSGFQILSLFARQSQELQSLVFANNSKVKIILATNVAETSLTIPGIKYVIDSGLVRLKRYIARNKTEQLLIEKTSQASSIQRSGRAGRLSHGMCIRLYSESDFLSRNKFTLPEILRTNLSNVILRLLNLKLGDPTGFPFLDQPTPAGFNDGYKHLNILGAVNDKYQITQEGKILAKIPVDVSLAKILYFAANHAALKEALIIVSFLAIQNPLEYPLEYQEQARAAHGLWQDKKSQFVQILNLWTWFNELLTHKKTNKKLLLECNRVFVSLTRLKEWLQLHNELKEVMFNLAFKENTTATDYISLHRAILAGLITNLGIRSLVDKHYLGANGRKFYLHPQSLKTKARAIIAFEITETSLLYAKIIAEIEPQWILGLCDHLIKAEYINPRYDAARGEVVSLKIERLFGLEINRKTTGLGVVNPVLAREIFIREALVNNSIPNYDFILHNKAVINKITNLEAKLRISLMVLEEVLFNFYQENLADDVFDLISLQKFIKKSAKGLELNYAEIIQACNINQDKLELYPNSLIVNEIKCKLKYVFNRESLEDGLIVELQLKDLELLANKDFSWLVPGLIREKISFLIKSLGKEIRLRFNPLEASISDFLTTANFKNDFLTEFIKFSLSLGLKLTREELEQVAYPTNLKAHFRVLEYKQLLASSDDLTQLKQQLGSKLKSLIKEQTQDLVIYNITEYREELSDLLKLNSKFNAYLSLELEHNSLINLVYIANFKTALLKTKAALSELIKQKLFNLINLIKKQNYNELDNCAIILRQEYGTKAELKTAIFEFIIQNGSRISLTHFKLGLTELEFNQLVEMTKTNWLKINQEFYLVLSNISNEYSLVKKALIGHPLADIILEQLGNLIYPGFLNEAKWEFLKEYPRYLKGLNYRLERYFKHPVLDQNKWDEVTNLYDLWDGYLSKLDAEGKETLSALYDFYFKIEELKLSFFAPQIKTLYPVSIKRLVQELNSLLVSSL